MFPAAGGPAAGSPEARLLPGDALAACARDLKQNAGRSLVIVGDAQPPIVHAIAHAINEALGNVGRTVSYSAPILARAESQGESMRVLTDDMAAGRVDTLIMLGGNPVYNAPADRLFGAHLAKLAMSVHLSLYDDETSSLCDWQIPQAHFLESWSDTRAFDGTVAIQQPLIAPLYGGKSAHELLALLLGQAASNDYQTVRDFWTKTRSPTEIDAFWNQALHRGLIEGSQTARARRRDPIGLSAARRPTRRPQPQRRRMAAASLDLIFAPDPTVWDGRFANNAWLQELPKPLTKLTWDNAALVGPALAERLGLANGDQVELRVRDAVVLAPVWIIPGQPDSTVTVTLGYGRKRAGRIGDGVGYDAYVLASVGRSLACARTAAAQDRRKSRPGHDAAPFLDGGPPAHTDDDARAVPQRSHARNGRRESADPQLVSTRARRRLRLGDEHQSGCLHRLQRLHDRLPGREQHTGRRQEGSDARA